MGCLFCHLSLDISVADQDHSQQDCFVCCICSHGDQDLLRPTPGADPANKFRISDLVYGTDGFLYLRLITEMFREDNCPSLAGKPKLFFFQVGYF